MGKVNLSKVYGVYKPPKLPKQFDYQLPSTSNNYWYIVAKAGAGDKSRVLLLGPYQSEDKAFEVATNKINAAFQVVELPTKDRGAATQMIRHKVLNESSDIGLSIKRMRHQV